MPVGSERVTKDGIRQRKVTDTGCPPRDWKSVHGLLWEKHYGPVPAGYIVVFKNGDRADIRIDNLEMISRAENMRRNTIHNLPEPLAEVCRLRGVLNRHIKKREREHEEQD
ncbi:MAG: HNH endonuclease signature motif containing protein [Desulfosalsimonas sp.]